jgi:imidazolonepropionase-like amidohydrolase
VNDGKAAGPRIQASGPYLTIPHGGGDLYIPDFKEPEDNARFHAGVARGPEQFREKAEMLLAGGADLLKVIASGAVLAFGSEPGAPEMTQEEIAAVVQVAHAQGKKVAAHAHGAASILMAIAAGADTIEHASYLDDAGIAAAIRQGHVAFSMDVYNGDYIDTEGRRMNWPEEFLRKNTETTEIQRLAFTRAVKAGAPIVFGTDSAVYPHGFNARQFPIMVQRGMTPMQAIQAATSLAAEFMGWSDRVGALEAGRYGDLIAVRDDPLADISALKDVAVVIKGGLIFKLP